VCLCVCVCVCMCVGEGVYEEKYVGGARARECVVFGH
jgi:hypothetical protein